MTTKVHTRYKTKDGIHVPGVTTILGMLDKPALLDWAWKLGLAGEDFRKVRDKAASIGTIAHYLTECHLKKEKPDMSEFSPADVDKAENSFLGYLDFEKQHNLEVIFSEMPLVSENLKFGGTIDCYAKVDGKLSLIDFKTSKGVFPEMRVQVAAYRALLEECGHKVEKVHLLRIDKESGEFNHHQMDDLENEWKLFQALLAAYPLKQIVWKK